MVKENLKERLRKKKLELKAKSQQGAIFFQKPDTTIRVRILNMGEEEEFVKEVIQFYLGPDLKGVISPATYGMPCGIMESYDELKNSENDDDKELAGKFFPRNRYLAFCLFYKDERGKEIDEQLSPKFLLVTGGVYQEILDLYLDESDWGDMTDPVNGYDIKIKRIGSGKMDTEYTVMSCKNTPVSKAFSGPYNLDEEIKKILPTYEKTKEMIEQFLGLDPEDEGNGGKRKKRVKKGIKKIIKKKTSDLDE